MPPPAPSARDLPWWTTRIREACPRRRRADHHRRVWPRSAVSRCGRSSRPAPRSSERRRDAWLRWRHHPARRALRTGERRRDRISSHALAHDPPKHTVKPDPKESAVWRKEHALFDIQGTVGRKTTAGSVAVAGGRECQKNGHGGLSSRTSALRQLGCARVVPTLDNLSLFLGSWLEAPLPDWISESALLSTALSNQTLRFSAEVLPRLATSSYSTVCPSLRVERPAFSTAEI